MGADETHTTLARDRTSCVIFVPFHRGRTGLYRMTALKIATVDVPTALPSPKTLPDDNGDGGAGSNRNAAPVNDDDPNSLLLDIRQLSRLLSPSRTTLWRMVAGQRLPQPIYLSPKSPRWRRSEIEQHIARLTPGRRPQARRQRGAANE